MPVRQGQNIVVQWSNGKLESRLRKRLADVGDGELRNRFACEIDFTHPVKSSSDHQEEMTIR